MACAALPRTGAASGHAACLWMAHRDIQRGQVLRHCVHFHGDIIRMRLLMRRSLAWLARARARTGNTLRRSERDSEQANISDKV